MSFDADPIEEQDAEMYAALEEQDSEMCEALASKDKRIAELERILSGVPQDAIDGGWTAAGLSEYAKSLEVQLQNMHAASMKANTLIAKQSQEIIKLELKSQPAPDSRDAARYRWLRDVAQAADWEWIAHQTAPETTDTAIDAAMQPKEQS